MADNVNITAGAGTIIAAKDRSGVEFQQFVDASAFTSGGAFAERSVTTAAAALPGTPGSALKAFITVEGNSIRWTHVGTPTTTSGHLLVSGGAFEYDGPMDTFRMIAITSTTATVSASYYTTR